MKKLIHTLFIPLFFLSCATYKPQVNKKIYESIVFVKKPAVENYEDIQKAYIDLFEAYEKNLNLLNFLNKSYN
ncbi:hypothetical protein LW135_06745 [Helicobacter sp. faydin-H20]|uniref:hypothetical protein n=1 Tax=Helicobacter anatolicus TaxID=2905874 RepID=UPI001E4C9DBA|nr:hypothetical protein [Helicobacter anatolicus]MCE3037517.1 hypothetical protein [Helicobacter anatolicus]